MVSKQQLFSVALSSSHFSPALVWVSCSLQSFMKKKSWLLHRLLFLSGKLLQHGLSTSYRAVSAPALWTINSSSSLSDLHVPSATSHCFCSFLLSLSCFFCSFLNIFSLRRSLCCFTYSTPPPNENMKNMKIFFTDILKHRFSHIFLQVI